MFCTSLFIFSFSSLFSAPNFDRSYLCRSTSARLEESCSLNLRTNHARRQQTKNSRLKTSYTYVTIFRLFVYKRYVVVTYQPHAQICTSCKRYLVVTYRSIIFTPCKKHVSYTCNSGEPIHLRTEQLRVKQIFFYFPYCIFKLLLGAIFKTIFQNYYTNPPSSTDLWSN